MAPLRCHVLGHDWDFWTSGPELRWACARCGREGGRKRYQSAAEAQRYGAHFDRRPRGPANVLAALGGRRDREVREDRDR
jgi:hypothetical protein